MTASTQERWLFSKNETRFFASVVFLISLLSTAGWIFNIPYLTSIFPEWIPIQPSTIACFIFLSVVLWFLPHKNKRPARMIIIPCLIFTALISSFAYISFLFSIQFNINTFLPFLGNHQSMSFLNAINFLMICVAFFNAVIHNTHSRATQYLFLLSLIMPMIISLGYFYEISLLFKIPAIGSVSFISAILFMIVSFTGLFSSPAIGITRLFIGDTASSKLAKYLIPCTILIPLIAGNLWITGHMEGLYNVKMGVALMVGFILLTFIPIIYATSIWLTSSEEQLAIARRNAEAAANAKSAFLTVMSHEIRTPLHAVMGMTDLLSDTHPSLEQQRYINTIQHSGQTVLHIINDILDYSKIESGRIQIEKIDFDFFSLLNEAVEIVSFQAHQKGLKLITQIDPSMPSCIKGDPIRIKQVLINLLNNAVKFSSHGVIALSVSRHENNIVRIEVKDQGIGITPEVRLHLFQAFSQGDASTTRKYGGTGLGLAISKRLIEAMGGQIDVESTSEKGSTFWFTLPLILGSHPAIVPHTRLNASELLSEHRKNAHILIVEDNEINQHVLHKTLEKLGFNHIDIVTNGLEAVKAVDEIPYNLIFMDCQMPEMDGYSATREIRAHHKHHLPIVAMTAHALKDDRIKCLAAGMNDYVSKPITRDELIRVLHQWIPEKAIIKLTVLDKERLNDIFGDEPEALKKFLEKAVKSITNLLTEIGKNITARDEIAAKTSAHTLKGVTGNMGAMKMYDLAKTLEQHIIQKNWTEAQKLFDAEQIAFTEVVKTIEKELI